MGKQLKEESVPEHYTGLLGVEAPWQVSQVVHEPSVERVLVRIAWPAGVAPRCSQCGKEGIWHDSREREWRHLDAMGHEVRLCCAVPRCQCQKHGVKTEPGNPARSHQILLNSAEGLDFQTAIDCAYYYSVAKDDSTALVGVVSDERRRVLKRKIIEVLRLL